MTSDARFRRIGRASAIGPAIEVDLAAVELAWQTAALLARWCVIVLLGCGGAASPRSDPPAGTPTERSFPETCQAIARDIEALRQQYPQLTNYRAVDQADCRISYGYKTQRPTGRGGGWGAGVPVPDAEGIWLYIGIWDPAAPNPSQLDTQPAGLERAIGNRRVTYLMLEGDKVTSARAAIEAILVRHGLTTEM